MARYDDLVDQMAAMGAPADPKVAESMVMGIIKTDPHAEHGITTYCSCGKWVKRHPRQKVREDAAERHLAKRHGGQGIWL